MDQLKQLITYKLKFIQQYRLNKMPTQMSSQQKQKMIQLFLKQKRKQNSRDVIQSRLLQLLSSRKIEAPYRVQEFYRESLAFMKGYDDQFDGAGTDSGKDVLENIVKLYMQFFMKNDCARRAQQIQHIYKKNLCQKGMLIPTIFNWFVEWLRKAFKQFIKKTLNILNSRTNSSMIQQSKKQKNKKFLQQISAQKASLSIIDSEIKQNRLKEKQCDIKLNLKLKGNKSKLLNPDFQMAVGGSAREIIGSRLSCFRNRNQNQLGIKIRGGEGNIQIGMIVSSRQYSAISYNYNNNSMQASSNQKQSIQFQKQKQKVIASPSPSPNSNQISNINSNININKDIFFSAFYEQLGTYYKFYSCLQQLDDNYPRNFRKVDRRQEVLKNINVLVKSMMRNQPNQIRNSLDDYYNKYNAKYPKIQPLTQNENKISNKNKKKVNKQRQKEKQKRAQSVDIGKKHLRQFSPPKQKTLQSIPDFPNQSKKNSKEMQIKQKAQSQTHRVQVQKNKIQLQLPQIKSFKSVQKIIIVNHSEISLTHRYGKNNNNTNQKQRVSAQLYKELREISSLFRSRKGIRKQQTYDRSYLEERKMISPINFRDGGGNKEISQILEGSGFQGDGIFRLPKIHK